MLKSNDLRLLHDFAAVCRAGTVTGAADELGTVQSAVTQRMQRLEDAMGVKLLKRHSRGVVPTEQGRILLKHAKRLDDLVADAIAEVRAWEESPSGAVSIGLPPSVSATLTTPLIEEVNASLPNIELTVAEALSGYLPGWLENGEIDFGLAFDMASSKDLLIAPLVEEDLYLITAPQTAETLPERLSIEDLAGLRLIAPTRRHGLRTGIDDEAARRGLSLNIVLEVDAGRQLIRQVMRGAGSAVLARSAVMEELRDGTLKALPIIDPVFRRTVCLAMKRERSDSFLLQSVRVVLENVVDRLVLDGDWLCVRLDSYS